MGHYIACIDGMTSSSGEEDVMHMAIDYHNGDINSNSGVLNKQANHYLVEENSTPNTNLKINPGVAYIKNNTGTKAYRTYLDAALTNVAVAANATGSDRADAVILYIDTSASPDATASNVAKVTCLENGNNGEADPTSTMTDAEIQSAIDAIVGESNVPWTRLDDPVVPNGFSSITNADLNDVRVKVSHNTPNEDGWIKINVAATRIANHTFTLPIDATGFIGKGTRFKYKESGGSWEYGVSESDSSYSSPDTTVDLAVNTDYTMATSPVEIYYSNGNPADYPGVFNYSPDELFTTTGNGSLTGKFSVNKNQCRAEIKFTLGSTSAVATGASFDPPISIASDVGQPVGHITMNETGGSGSNPGFLRVESAGRLRWLAQNASGTYVIGTVASAIVPFTFGNTDEVYGVAIYDI